VSGDEGEQIEEGKIGGEGWKRKKDGKLKRVFYAYHSRGGGGPGKRDRGNVNRTARGFEGGEGPGNGALALVGLGR